MRWRRIALLFSIVVCTARCGTLFNQQRNDTATSAQKKFTDAKLTDLLTEERKHNAEILAREIEIAQRQMTAARDSKLIAMVGSKSDLKTELTTAIAERVKLLQGTDRRHAPAESVEVTPKGSSGSEDDAQVKKLQKLEIPALLLTIEEQENAFSVDKATYLIARTKKDPKPDCTLNTLPVSPDAEEYFELVASDCQDLERSRKELATRTNAGLLGSTAQAIAAAERARIETAAQVKKAEEEALKAVKAVADEQQNARAGLVLDAKALEDLRKRVGKVMIPDAEDLGGIGLNDVRLAAALRWAEIQKAAVDQILAAATAGGPPSAGLSDHLQVAALVPSLAEQLREGFRYPRVSALVMEAQRLRIEGDRYRRQLGRVDEELELQRAKLRRLRSEWDLLSEATSQLNDGNTDVALQKYTEAWTGGRIPLTATEWKLIGLTHERALDQSEAALAQWDGLVRVPLEALVASAGSGLKPDEIARLLQTLEMSALAAGVF
jgi:hypothetical protein